jgi:hypothetical protein
MARCPTCQSDTFRVDESQAGPVLACDGCGRALGAAIPARMEALIRELEAVREVWAGCAMPSTS